MPGPLSFTGVLLGVASAVAWGAGDFSGGRAAGRHHQFHVLVIAAFSGMAFLLVIAVLGGEPLPSVRSAAWAAAAGVSGALGIASLYRALAVGSAARVAPLAALVSVVIPVLVNVAARGWPPAPQLAGFAVALPGVWLVSRSGERPSGSGHSLWLAALAGVGFGGFLVLIARVDAGPVLGPVVVARSVSVLVGLALVAGSGLGPVPLRGAGYAWLAGGLDATGNVLYLLATRHTRLDVAAVLSSMYPAVTVLLARGLVPEHVTRLQWLGLILCLVAVGLIAA